MTGLEGSRRLRVLLAATLMTLLAGGLLLAGPKPPDPPKPEKPPERPKLSLHAHRRYVVGQLFHGLRNQLELAERMGDDPYLVRTAQDARMMLGATVATDSYDTDEKTHLEKAGRDVDAYLAETDRSPASLKPRLARIHKALDALELVRKSLTKRQGGKP